jgi:hypothetical protein
LNTAYKVFSKTLYAKLLTYAEIIIGNYQSGSLREKSTLGPICTLRQILGKTGEFNVGSRHLFIEFNSACNSINRNLINCEIGESNYGKYPVPSKSAVRDVGPSKGYEWAKAR